jgi:leader peptidase (prepilin peptidase)/N-methyltransferase
VSLPIVVLVALVGAAVGRVAALAVERVPLDDPRWAEPHACRACGARRAGLAWVPVIGPLTARCSACGTGVPRWEAVLDVVMAVMFALLAKQLDDGIVLTVYLPFAAILITLAAIDLQTLRLPDRLTIPTFLLGIPLLAAAGVLTDRTDAFVPALVGAVSYFGVLLVAHVIYPRGMGFGDVKLALSMGLWVGWMRTDGLSAFSVVLYAMLMGFALGTVAGLAVMAVRRRSAPYPFGPFLVLGALLAILLSDSLPR